MENVIGVPEGLRHIVYDKVFPFRLCVDMNITGITAIPFEGKGKVLKTAEVYDIVENDSSNNGGSGFEVIYEIGYVNDKTAQFVAEPVFKQAKFACGYEKQMDRMHSIARQRKRGLFIKGMKCATLVPTEKSDYKDYEPVVYDPSMHTRLFDLQRALVRLGSFEWGYSGGGYIEIDGQKVCKYFSSCNGSTRIDGHSDCFLLAQELDRILAAYRDGEWSKIPGSIHIELKNQKWNISSSGQCGLLDNFENDLQSIDHVRKMAKAYLVPTKDIDALKRKVKREYVKFNKSTKKPNKGEQK